MEKIIISGGKTLSGIIRISGSKNSALPILAASLLSKNKIILENIPNLSDLQSMLKLLESLNSTIVQTKEFVKIKSGEPQSCFASYNLVRKMRASFLVLGPLLARYSYAKVSLPGGCAIGARPINIHLECLEKMGVNFNTKDGYVIGKVEGLLKGAEIQLPFSSVGATENILMAATLAKGKTVIKNAAIEPEISDLANFLNVLGAEIYGIGTRTLKIIGKKKLIGGKFSIMPDRIEAGTFILAVLGCKGKIKLTNLNKDVIEHLISIFSSINELHLKISKDKTMLEVSCVTKVKKNLKIKTDIYPGFPTDLQAQLIAAMCISDCETQIEETIFENRFMHVQELIRMGADIRLKGSNATIVGKKKINGAEVMATDLRASSSLIIAGLMADGLTTINRIYHLDRGYENLVEKLSSCCAEIKRI